MKWFYALSRTAVVLSALVACVADDGSGSTVFELLVEPAKLSPGGTAIVTALRSGVPIGVTWQAEAGHVEQQADDSWVYLAPQVPGRFMITGSVTGTTAEAEVVVVSPAQSVTATLDASGGVVALTDGSQAIVPPSALVSSTDVVLESFEAPAGDYGGATPIGPSVRLTVPKGALDLTKADLVLTLPAPLAVAGRPSTLAELRVSLLDGSNRTYVVPYSHLDPGLTEVSIPSTWLRSLDETVGLPDTVSLVAQPVDVADGADGVAGQAVDYVTGLFKVDLAAADFSDAASSCGSGVQGMPTWISAAVDPPEHQPVVLVHGWQVLGNLNLDTVDNLERLGELSNPIGYLVRKSRAAPERNPAYCAWVQLVHYLADLGIGDDVDLYVFGYDSEGHVAENATRLKDAVESTFAGSKPIIIAHSMGGMVADVAHQQGLEVNAVLSLGTPYRGSLALLCSLPSPLKDRCWSATVHPLLYAEAALAHPVLPALVSGLTFAASLYQGTRDLTWDAGNPMLEIVHGGGSRDYSEFTAFWGDIQSDLVGQPMALMQLIFYSALGRKSDGIVPEESAVLDLADGEGARVGSTDSFLDFDHNALTGGGDLESAPDCEMSHADLDRARACEAMSAIGDWLKAKLLPPDEPGGLVAYYTFDTVPGADSSGVGNDAVAYGDPELVPGVLGSAVRLDGVDDYLRRGALLGGNKFSEYTHMGWFRVDAHPSDVDGSVIFSDETTDGMLGLRLGEDGKPSPVHHTGTDYIDWFAGPSVAVGNWHHYAVTWDGTELVYFLDGLVVGNASVTGVKSAPEDVTIGALAYWLDSGLNDGGLFTGAVDELRVYTRALLPTEVQSAYADVLGHDSYLLSSTPDGLGDIGADDDIDVFLNSSVLREDPRPSAGPRFGPLAFIANPGDVLQVVVTNNYQNTCSWDDIWLIDPTGASTLVLEGEPYLGTCSIGVVAEAEFVIP